MKSTWAQVRMDSFFILCHFPDAFGPLNDSITVNDLILATARDLANNPKAMLAEASALFLNLLFKKCLRHVSVVPPAIREAGNLHEMQLSFLNFVVGELRDRVKTFQVALIKEGKKEALLHGYLSFFKHLFEDFHLPEGLARDVFL